jgi:hypothetical protein
MGSDLTAVRNRLSVLRLRRLRVVWSGRAGCACASGHADADWLPGL